MTALIIIGVIVALIISILLIKVRAHFSLNSAVEFKVTLLNKTLLKLPISQKIEVAPDGTAYKKDKKTGGYFTKLKKKEGFFSALKTVINMVYVAINKTTVLLRKIRINNFKFGITVADADCAKTALIYSGACSVVFPLVSFIECNTKIDKKDVFVNADFDNTSFDIDVDIKASLRIFHLLVFAFALFYEYMKIIAKKEGA